MKAFDAEKLVSFPPSSRQPLHELKNDAGLSVELWPNGALCAVRYADGLVNQAVGMPPEGAPFRLWLRSGAAGKSLVGPATGSGFVLANARRAVWTGRWHDLDWTVHLVLDPSALAWAWHVDVVNRGAECCEVDAVIAQDVGLATEAAVRSNENYVSHYIDHSAYHHPVWGPVLFSRQNLPQKDGRHPLLSLAAVTGAVEFATDALDVFGLSQRTEGRARVLDGGNLPSRVRQGELACQSLQARRVRLAASASTRFTFSARLVPDQPEPVNAGALAAVKEPAPLAAEVFAANAPPRSIWDAPHLLHGEKFSEEEWREIYPVRLHEEVKGTELWSFFTPDGAHVASAAKERALERSHGQVLLASDQLLPDEQALGATAYACGIFGAQIYVGNPNFNRMVPVVRDGLQRTRGFGQRVWVHDGDDWQLLGTPSAFEMGLARVRWLYRRGERLIEIVQTVVPSSALRLICRVIEGAPVRWRVTHQLAMGANELDQEVRMTVDETEAALQVSFAPDTEAAKRWPGLRFGLQAGPPGAITSLGGDELVWCDGESRGAPYAVLESAPAPVFEITINAAADGAVRGDRGGDARPPSITWRLNGGASLMSLADILPWMRHDAWIHLAAPHGLEQYGGAAWGVRDVCQGSVEWLLTEQRYAELREILGVVFAQQYFETALWPQWFMLGRCADIQQTHCHGDIMFWPVKALCDYAAAANDLSILDWALPFTRARGFQKTRERFPLSEHLDRMIAKYRDLCVPGTSLIAYGEGDWDDTLQPARAEMREGMVSAWTAQLAYEVFRQLAELYRRAGRDAKADEVGGLADAIREDFMRHLMPDGIVSGFATFRPGGVEPLLHPRDKISGLRYRLLPMSRGILSGIFDARQARTHLQIIKEHLRFPDGVRLMNRPVEYRGGRSQLFQRAETSAYFGRETSLQYVHAHLRYAEAVARYGDGDEVVWALQTANPLDLSARLPNAAPRQSNVYFSSSDAAVHDRYEAMTRFEEIRRGVIPVKAGWRLYSSGPGLFLHKVRCVLLGIREHYDHVIFDPVLPASAEPLAAELAHEGAKIQFAAVSSRHAGVSINGRAASADPAKDNPYRPGGLVVERAAYRSSLRDGVNQVEVRVALPGRRA